MKAAAEDRANWSSGKMLQDFGAQRGIRMDDAPDLETLQDRLNQIQGAWNALPIHERQLLMPHPGDRDDESGRDRALAAYDVDGEVTALLLGFGYELPSGRLPPTTETAPKRPALSTMRGLDARTRTCRADPASPTMPECPCTP
jgi:hypothetical protein